MGKISSTGEVIVSNDGDWVDVPIGMHDAICCDWYIIPEYNTVDYGIQERIAIDFMVGAKTPDGDPMTIRKTLNNTISPKGNLMKQLRSWKDDKPVDIASCKFDKLLGVKATLMVDDFSGRDGEKIAYIAGIKPAQKTNQLVIDSTLQRKMMVKVDGVPDSGAKYKWELVPRDDAPAAIPAPAAAPAPAKLTPETIANPPAPAPAPAAKEAVDDVPF